MSGYRSNTYQKRVNGHHTPSHSRQLASLTTSSANYFTMTYAIRLSKHFGINVSYFILENSWLWPTIITEPRTLPRILFQTRPNSRHTGYSHDPPPQHPQTKRRVTGIPNEVCNLITNQYNYAPKQPACDYVTTRTHAGPTSVLLNGRWWVGILSGSNKWKERESHNSPTSTAEM